MDPTALLGLDSTQAGLLYKVLATVAIVGPTLALPYVLYHLVVGGVRAAYTRDGVAIIGYTATAIFGFLTMTALTGVFGLPAFFSKHSEAAATVSQNVLVYQDPGGGATETSISASSPFDVYAYLGTGDEALAEADSSNTAGVSFSSERQTAYRLDGSTPSTAWVRGSGNNTAMSAVMRFMNNTAMTVVHHGAFAMDTRAIAASTGKEFASDFSEVYATSSFDVARDTTVLASTDFSMESSTTRTPTYQHYPGGVFGYVEYAAARIDTPEIISYSKTIDAQELIDEIEAESRPSTLAAGTQSTSASTTRRSAMSTRAAAQGYDESKTGVPAETYLATHTPLYLAQCAAPSLRGEKKGSSLVTMLSPASLASSAGIEFLSAGATSGYAAAASKWLNGGSAALQSLGGAAAFVSNSFNIEMPALPTTSVARDTASLRTAQRDWSRSMAPEAVSNRACLRMGEQLIAAALAVKEAAHDNAEIIDNYITRQGSSYALERSSVLALSTNADALATAPLENLAGAGSVLALAADIWKASTGNVSVKDNTVLENEHITDNIAEQERPGLMSRAWASVKDATVGAITKLGDYLLNLGKNVMTILGVVLSAPVLLMYATVYWGTITAYALVIGLLPLVVAVHFSRALSGEGGQQLGSVTIVAIPMILGTLALVGFEMVCLAVLGSMTMTTYDTITTKVAEALIKIGVGLFSPDNSELPALVLSTFMELIKPIGIIVAMISVPAAVGKLLFLSSPNTSMSGASVAGLAGGAMIGMTGVGAGLAGVAKAGASKAGGAAVDGAKKALRELNSD